MAIGIKRPRNRAPRIAIAIAGPVALVAVLGQALLPSIAADRARATLDRYGSVGSVSVSAWPAIELLWGKADSLTVHATKLTVSPTQIASLLAQARGFHEVTVSAGQVTLLAPGLPTGLTVSNARVRKQGASVSASATVTQAQLDHALPGGLGVRPLSSGPQGVTVRASGALFGVRASIDVLARPLEGNIVAEPEGVPFGSLASITLFSNPRLKVRRIAVGAVPGQPSTYSLYLGASIR